MGCKFLSFLKRGSLNERGCSLCNETQIVTALLTESLNHLLNQFVHSTMLSDIKFCCGFVWNHTVSKMFIELLYKCSITPEQYCCLCNITCEILFPYNLLLMSKVACAIKLYFGKYYLSCNIYSGMFCCYLQSC